MPDPRRITLLSIEDNGLVYELSVNRLDPDVLTHVESMELDAHVVVRPASEDG